MSRTASLPHWSAALEVWVLLAPPTGPAAALAERGQHAGQRTLPPSTLSCERNALTSWQGEVREYRRTDSSIRFLVYTDWETVEELNLTLGAGEVLPPYFLIQGKPFSDNDWSKIESSPGQLRKGMRAIVWVCLDEQTEPTVDWRPGEAGHRGR